MKEILLLSCLLISTIIRAQNITTKVVNTTGGEGSAGSLRLDWSIGEIAIHTFQPGSIVLTEGVMQPNDLLVVLPVKLISFTAKRDESTVALNWRTAVELNTDWFYVERSTNAAGFTTIGKVKALGYSGDEQEYSFIDSAIAAPNLYYRLKSSDINGSFEYSKTIAVKNQSGNEVFLFPNPVNSILTLTTQGKELIRQVSLTDGQGKTIKNFIPTNGSRNFSLDLTGFKPGLYFLCAKIGDKVIVKQILKL